MCRGTQCMDNMDLAIPMRLIIVMVRRLTSLVDQVHEKNKYSSCHAVTRMHYNNNFKNKIMLFFF
jgi:hypothetical protein